MPDDATESVAAHSSIINYLHAVTTLMFGYSGTQIHDPEVRDEGSGQPWDNGQASWSSVIPQTRTKELEPSKNRLIEWMNEWMNERKNGRPNKWANK